jgi:hypothetical protein
MNSQDVLNFYCNRIGDNLTKIQETIKMKSKVAGWAMDYNFTEEELTEVQKRVGPTSDEHKYLETIEETRKWVNELCNKHQ